MELKRYLFENELSISEFAEKIDVHKNVISYLKTGNKMCGKKTARLIERVTNGQVTIDDLRYTCDQRKLKKLRLDKENTIKKLNESGMDNDLQIL